MLDFLVPCREALPGVDPQAAANHTYYHRGRQGPPAPSAHSDAHELESLMSPLPEEAPAPLTDITELTEVHGLIHTSLQGDGIHGNRKVTTVLAGQSLGLISALGWKVLSSVDHCQGAVLARPSSVVVDAERL